MRIPRFYQNTPISVDNILALDDDAVGHVARVLRMRCGESIILFNGDGNEYHAELVEVEKRRVNAKILSSTQPNRISPLQIDIGQSISRGERMDYAIQKATELGMNSMTPLLSERCEVRLKADRLAKKQQQWQQLSISACEQSLRTTTPVIQAATSLEAWVNNCQAELKLVLHHHCAEPLDTRLQPQSIALLIGPEGGLSDAEVEHAKKAGFQSVVFGPRVLRTETAPVAALSILQYLWGDLG